MKEQVMDVEWCWLWQVNLEDDGDEQMSRKELNYYI